MLSASPLVKLIAMKDRVRLVFEEEVMEYAESSARFMAFIDDEIVFGFFIVVRRLLQRSPSLLKRQCRTDTCRWDTSFGCGSVGAIIISS